MTRTRASLTEQDLFVVAFGASKADLRMFAAGPRWRIGERSGANHAATSARTDVTARAVIQSAACCALLAAVKIARLSALSTRSQD
jgi:hypothetical protein